MTNTFSRKHSKWPRLAFTLVELLVVIAIIGILVALLLPAINSARAAAYRTQCKNKLKQLGLAANTYAEANKKLPSSFRPSGNTSLPRIAGLTLILPYIEENNLYKQFDLKQNWSHASNLPVTSKTVDTFLCPSSPESSTRLDGNPQPSWVGDLVACTDYSPLVEVDPRAVNATWGADVAGKGALSKVVDPAKDPVPKIKMVTDGLSKTIFYAESAGRPHIYQGTSRLESTASRHVNGGGWARPASDFSLDGSSFDGKTFPQGCALNCTNGEDFGTTFPHPFYLSEGSSEAYSFHPGGAHFAFGDGSVNFINENITLRELARFVTRSGGEATSSLD